MPPHQTRRTRARVVCARQDRDAVSGLYFPRRAQRVSTRTSRAKKTAPVVLQASTASRVRRHTRTRPVRRDGIVQEAPKQQHHRTERTGPGMCARLVTSVLLARRSLCRVTTGRIRTAHSRAPALRVLRAFTVRRERWILFRVRAGTGAHGVLDEIGNHVPRAPSIMVLAYKFLISVHPAREGFTVMYQGSRRQLESVTLDFIVRLVLTWQARLPTRLI